MRKKSVIVKRIIPLALVSLLAMGTLGGCANQASNTGDSTGSTETTQEEVVDNSAGVSTYGYNLSGVAGPTGLEFGGGTGQTDFTPIDFTAYEEDIRQAVVETNFQGEVMRQITADTGVNLQTNFGVGDVSEQITLMIADRNYPDFVFSRSNLSKFLEAEAFIDLAPLIEEYGPNIKKLYGTSFDTHYDEEGHIHYLGQDFVNNLPLDPEVGFEVQLAVLEEQGYPEIKTLDQYAEAIRTYKAAHPEIDGQPTIGITLTTGEGWRWFITLGNPAGFANGAPDDGQYYVDPETMETIFRFTMPEHKEYFRWMNGLYNEGLLDPDSFTQTHDEYLQKIASGRVLGLMDANWSIEEATSVLTTEGKPERAYGFFPVTVDESVLFPIYRQPVYMASNGIGITDNCDDPIRAIQFLDYLAREEIQVMTNWGFEGVNWEVRDGERKWTAEEFEKRTTDPDGRTVETGHGLLSYPWPCYGSGVNDADGLAIMPFTEDEIMEGYTEPAKAALDAYGVGMWRDLYPQAEDLYFPPWGAAWYIQDALAPDSEIGQIQARCNDLTAEYLMRAVAAPEDEFDAIWDEYQQKLQENEVDKLGEMMTELVKERASWYTGE
ncbi:MAG: hypothetical protein LBV33_02015 [Lachnospiraceae bacterium]|nr:hypothetical protein [Lachnospiraceae bacterium]